MTYANILNKHATSTFLRRHIPVVFSTADIFSQYIKYKHIKR